MKQGGSLERSPIDRSPKLKVGARVQVVVGFRAAQTGVIECPFDGSSWDSWIVRFLDGSNTPYPSESLCVLPKLTSSTAIKKVNPKRKAETFTENFGDHGKDGEWIRGLPCCAPGCEHPSQAAHAKSRGAGGDRSDLVPICGYHHHEQHKFGVAWFEGEYGVDLSAIAARHSQTRDLNWSLADRLEALMVSCQEEADVLRELPTQADTSFEMGRAVDNLDELLGDAKVRCEPVAEERVTA